MANGKTVQVLDSKIRSAKRVLADLGSLIETAEIQKNGKLMASIRRAEKDIKAGRLTKVSSRKELDAFFRK